MRLLIIFIIILFPFFSFGQTGLIMTVAGNGTGGNGGDNNPAISASLDNPGGLAFDQKGNLYIVTTPGNPKVRKVDTFGIITTFAGTGTSGFSGDDSLAVNAELNYPICVAVDSKGNVYISEGSNHRIRKVDTAGIITTYAGNGIGTYMGDSGQATAASLFAPWGISFDKNDNLYIADHANNRVRKIDTNGIITTVAGIGGGGYNGDNILAINAKLWEPSSVVVDTLGNLYIADWFNNRIRKVDTNGIITTIAGDGSGGYNGDNIPAINAFIGNPYAIGLDYSNNLFLTDYGNARIRRINLTTGIITTVAGTGVSGYNGDSIFAINAQIHMPEGLTVDNCGNVYLSDVGNRRVRKIDLASCASDTTNAVNDITIQSSIHIYPNPTQASLHIDNVQTQTNYSLVDIIGVVLKKGILQKGNNEINTSILPNGIYFLKFINNDHQIQVEKIIKQ